MCHTKVVEKIKTHFVFSELFFFSKNSAVCEIMWKTIINPDRPQMSV